MSRIDESRPFVPVNIAVLTVSDTRTEADDVSGQTLVGRLRVEDMGQSEGQLEGLRASWILVEQIAELRGGTVRCRECQEHVPHSKAGPQAG